MQNKELIENFYTSFNEGNVDGMTECYHKDIVFQDPAFGELKGARAFKMWEMMLSSSKGGTKITLKDVETTEDSGSADWKAVYLFGDKKRKVVNQIHAEFKFKDGKIIKHTDVFDMWTWSKQALGISGYLLGWSAYMKNKVQKTANGKLDEYMKSNPV